MPCLVAAKKNRTITKICMQSLIILSNIYNAGKCNAHLSRDILEFSSSTILHNRHRGLSCNDSWAWILIATDSAPVVSMASGSTQTNETLCAFLSVPPGLGRWCLITVRSIRFDATSMAVSTQWVTNGMRFFQVPVFRIHEKGYIYIGRRENLDIFL